MKKGISLIVVVFFALMCMCVPISAIEMGEPAPVVDKFAAEAGAIVSVPDDFTVSEVMSFSELVEHYAVSNGISYKEALKYFPDEMKIRATRGGFTSRIISQEIYVNSEYRPRIDFYCETDEGGGFWGIKEIYSVQLVRNYNGIVKLFAGEISAWLRSAYEIEYIINGDFYNTGTMTVTEEGGVSGGVEGIFEASYSVSNSASTNYYDDCYASDIIYLNI